MSADGAAVAAKAVGTGTASVAVFALSPWAWVFALGGAAASFYFEPEKTPEKAAKLAFGIVAMGFAAACIAGSIDYLTWGWATSLSGVPVELRAGILGLSIRFLWERGRAVLRARWPGNAEPPAPSAQNPEA